MPASVRTEQGMTTMPSVRKEPDEIEGPMSACRKASRKRTPKMAPVDPVMPMMRRRLACCVSITASTLSDKARRSDASSRALEQVPEFLKRDAPPFRRRQVHRRELVAPMVRPAGVDHGAAVGVIAGRLALGLDARI